MPLLTFPANGLATFQIEHKGMMHHPFHMHGQRFQVISDNGLASIPGWKDTIDVYPGHTLTLVSELDNPGSWVYHCHILEHAEGGMIAQLNVQ